MATELFFDLAQGDYVRGQFLRHLSQGHYGQQLTADWPTELKEVQEFPAHAQLVLRLKAKNNENILLAALREGHEILAKIELEGGSARVTVASMKISICEQFMAELKELITPMPISEHGRRPVAFWTWGPYGPEFVTRRLDVPEWKEIEDNYSAQAELQDLMEFQPSTAGQLLLWRGEPGTGKTWALRALIYEWRSWADFSYIIDPDKFFGDQAGYMTRVLFSEESHGQEGEERWKVLILEDCGEMLSKDARERSGQGLSRLLNLVDGLIGQGLRVLVLVTTNEELGALHDAISRPGRCACNLEFKPLRGIHLEHWLQRHGLDPFQVGEATLAELFALAAGRDTKSHKLAGFAA